MDIEKIREARLAYPFRPFHLVLENGRNFSVDEAHWLAISPTKKFVLVVLPDDSHVTIAPESVRQLDFSESSPASEFGAAE